MNRRKKSNTRELAIKISTICLLSIVFLLAICYFIGVSYYKDHFFNNTMINGIDCSNKSLEDTLSLIRQKAESYVLTLEQRNDVEEQIYGTNIDLDISFGSQLEVLLKNQSPYSWLSKNRQMQTYEFEKCVTYNEEKLTNQINQLNCFQKDFIIEPQNAKISEYKPTGYEIIKEKPGTLLSKLAVTKYIKEAIINFDQTINLDEKQCYIEPKIYSDDSTLKLILDTLNLYTSTKLTYKFGDKTEVLDGSIIHSWLSIDSKNNVILDEAKVKEYVDYIGKNYNSFGRVRKFKTSYNKTVTVKGGDYGWWLNRGAEQVEIINAIYNGLQEVKTPNYYQTAMQYGPDDIGDTYVEINLSAQHLFFYLNGKLLIESDFVSGCVMNDHMTPVGTYGITYKEKDATLVGEDYETPVKYWMPFNGNVGLHDASWRSNFGGEIFLTNGSHGCINLPPNVAKTIYENIKKGIPVICYELPGTESYDKKKYDKLLKRNEKRRLEKEKLEKEKKLINNKSN